MDPPFTAGAGDPSMDPRSSPAAPPPLPPPPPSPSPTAPEATGPASHKSTSRVRTKPPPSKPTSEKAPPRQRKPKLAPPKLAYEKTDEELEEAVKEYTRKFFAKEKPQLKEPIDPKAQKHFIREAARNLQPKKLPSDYER